MVGVEEGDEDGRIVGIPVDGNKEGVVVGNDDDGE
jgi:hypothetical protein